MTTLFSNQFFDPNGKRQKVSEDPRNRAAEVVRMRDSQTSEARKNFDAELVRAKVNIFLRNVDRHIKSGEIKEAERELRKAKSLEPRNLYIHAFEERIAHIKRVHEETSANETVRAPGTAPVTSPPALSSAMPAPQENNLKKKAEIPRTAPAVAQVRVEQAQPVQQIHTNQSKPAEQETSEISIEHILASVEKLVEQGKLATAKSELARAEELNPTHPALGTLKKMMSLLEQRQPEQRQPEQRKNTTAASPPRGENDQVLLRSLTVPRSWKERYLEAYKHCLMEIWMQGGITSQESASLTALRERLEIDDAEHKNLERDVQWRVYINAIMEGCLFTSTEVEKHKIERLREEFRIPAEAHFKIVKKTREEIITLVNQYNVVMNEA